MQFVKDYRDNKELRDSFNELAEKVFGLNFENWYQNGFWKDNYNPYSIVVDGKVVANISVNKCNMEYNGSVLQLIQLGTVMTDPAYRGKGYSRFLMEKIMKDYENKVDGIYLYANDSVLDFYPKFGFTKRKEFRYRKSVSNHTNDVTKPVPMNTPNDWDKLVAIMKDKPQQGNMIMTGNEGLFMFYLSQFMTENVYYIEDGDTYVIAEVDEDSLILHAVLGEMSLEKVIASFGEKIKKVTLFFTPVDATGYEEEMVNVDDTTFFVKGKAFENLGDYKFLLQEISHA